MHDILLNGKCKEITPSVSGSYILPIFWVNPLLELSKNIILIIYLKLSEFSFNLFPILSVNCLIKKSQSPLFFFPFNSFGNMSDYESVLESVSRIKNADFLIYSYKTDELSTQERTKYYKNCNYDNLKIFQQKEGIRFVSDNGLSSIAYNEDFLSKAIKQLGLNLKVNPFGKIGIEYSIDTYEREIEK